jgi:Holliday junction resolvase RusA-like endonuclease
MQQSLFPIEKDKLNQSQLKKIQEELNQELLAYLRNAHKIGQAIFIPGNTPSLKNNKEILQIMTKQSACCHKKGGLMVKNDDGKWECSVCGMLTQRHTRPILTKSKISQQYEKEKTSFFEKNLSRWKEMVKDKLFPYPLGMYFIRNSHREFDYVNASQIVLDIMTEAGYYVDDSMINVIPEFLGYHVDAAKAGVILIIMNTDLYNFKIKLYGTN